ncbi:MAG: filamentous hemagglutinin N-terminal domain-containing protein [Sphingopyxis sp.]|nr:filamentous hemagglutinin N-terminal domain-containing protein [Sphingopyxis sp.]
MSVRSPSPGHRRSRLFATSAIGALALAAFWAAPAHAQLVQGTAPAQSNGSAPVVDQSVPNSTTVTLGGSRTVIDWDRFDIGSGDTANFVFANRNDIVLNRVGGAGSTINGDLNGMIGAGGPAGGNIWIYNANGVVIGANARINTGGLLVTTAAVDRATDSSAGGFLDGSSTSFGFTGSATGSAIAVHNGARINSYGGAIALVAPVVATEAGSAIAAHDGGNVLYGAASKYKISFRQTGADDLDLIGFEVAGSADGTGETGGLAMGGTTTGNRIFAAVVSKAGVISNIVSSGTVTATSVATDESGAIVLLGNHNLVGGAAGGMVASAGTSEIKVDNGSTLTAPAVSLITSDSITNNPNGVISAVGGTIDLLAKNGVIFGFGKLNTGTLTAEAYGRIYLSGTNNVGTLGGLRNTIDEIVFSNNASLDIAGDIVAGSEANIGVNGVASGTGLIRGASATLSGGGTFNLDSATRLGYVSAYAGNLTVNSNGDLRINLTGAGNDHGHTVTLNAASGGIRQTGGDALVGRVVASARDGIDLGAPNQFTNITANSTGGGAIDLRSVGGFTVAGSTSGTLNAVSDTGSVTGTGIDVGRLSASAAGSIDFSHSTNAIRGLGNVNAGAGAVVSTTTALAVDGNVLGSTVTLHANGGNLTQGSGSRISGKTITVTASGSIVQDAAAVIHGTGVTAASTTVQAADDLILAGANRLSDYGDVFLGWGSGSDVTYRSAYSLFFNGGATPIGALTLISDQGDIQQGNIAFTANSFSASATGHIDIGTAADNSIARLGNIGSSTGEVRLRVGTNNPLAIDGTISSASRVIFTARGAVSGSGKFATPGLYLGLIEGGTINVAGSTNLLQLGVSNADATVRADDSLTLSGTLAANGRKLTLIAGTGSITQTGGSFIGMGTLSATAAGDISLTAANSFSDVEGISTGGGRIALNATGALSVALNTTGSAAVTAGGDLSSNGITVDSLSVDAGHINLTNSVDVNSFTRLVAAYGDVLVTNNGGFTVAGDVTTNKPGLRTIDLRANGGGISQTAGTISGHYVSLRGAGDLVQSGTGRVDSNAAYFSGANVLLGGANNLVSNDTRIVATGNLTLRNAGAIDLTVIGGYTNGGVLSLTSDNGSISSADAINASALTAHAANGVVTFNNTNNLISEIRGLSAGTNATVRASGGYTLTGDIDVGGTLALYARTGISQTGGRIKATTLDAQLNQTMTTGSVLLGGANDVDNLYVLAASGAGDALFRDTDGFRVTYAVIGNRVTLTSDAGAITQASGFMDGVQANQLTVSAVDGISLNNDWNGIRTILGLTNSGTGGIDIASRGVNMALAGNVTAAGQTVNLAVQNASLSQTGGAIIARRLDVAARTGITLTQAGNNISQLGTLSNSASGGIAYTDSNGYSIVGNITAAGQSLTLGSLDSTVDIYQANTGSTITAGTLNINGGRYYTLRGVNGTGNAIGAIGNINVKLGLNTIGAVDFRGDVITDYIELLAGGDITQSSGRIENQGGQLAFWGTNISLTSATNRLGNILQLRTWDNGPSGWFNVGTGNVTLVSAGDVAVGYVSAVNASLTSGGNIGTISSGLAGNVNVERLSIASGGTVSLAGAIRALGNVTATGETFLNSFTDLAVTGTVNTGAGALALQSGGAIGQTGGSITAGVIDVSAATGIDLGRTNNIATITGLSTTNGDISFRNLGSIAVPAINAPGTLTLISDSGSVTQNSGTTLRANRLNASAGTLIDLTNANQLAGLGTLIAGTTISVTNHGSLSLTGDILANSVTLRSTFGAISQTGGVISALDLTASAQNGLNFGSVNNVGALHGLSTTFGDIAFRNQGNIVLSDVFALTGAVTLTSDSGSIAQSALTTIMAERLNASAATGITLDQNNSLVRTGTLSNSGTGGIRVKTTGNLDIADTVTSTGQAVRFDVGGALTQSAALGAYASLTINAGTGLYLDQANNFGATIFSLTTGSGDITVRNVGNLTVPALSTAGGTIRLISDTGTIGQTGILTANTLFAEARREIALGRNNVITNVGGLVNTSGTITFRDIDGFNITGDIRGSIVTGERLILSAGGTGDIVQTGGRIVADKLRVTTGGNLTLDGSANTFMNVEVLSVGGDVRLRAQDAFVVGYTLEAGGTMTLTSTNGSIGTELGSIGHVRADALYVNAATGIDINLPGNITPKVSLISAAGNIRYTSQGAMELLALRTPDRAIVSANALTQSGAIDIGSLDVLAGDIRLDMAGNRIGSIHAAMATSGDLVIADEDGIDIAGNLQASGTISLTAGGAGSITQSGGIITAPTVSLVAAGGNITLDRANAAGVYNARSAVGGIITLRNDGDLKVNAITAQNGTVNLTSNTGSVGQLLVPNNSIWTRKLNVNAATDIDLAAQNFTDLLGNLTAGGSIRYNSFHTLGLDGDVRAVGGVTFGIQGYLGQYSGTIAASHLDVTASGIALIGANDIGSTTASRFTASDDITFRSVNSILLGAVTTPGLLSLTSDNGGIAQTAAFSAGRFDAIAAGDIILEELNTLDTVYDVTAGGVFSLRSAGAIELDGRIAADDRVTLNTGGGLTQIGNTVIVTDRLEATAGTATAGGIRLLNHNRVGAVSLDASGNDIRFRNTGNIAINAINSPTGTVELISNIGKITQQSSGGLVAGSLILNAANGVELYNSDNQIARLDVISRGDVSISTGGSGWGGLLTVDRIDAAGRAVSVANYVAGITGGNTTAASLNLFSAGDTDLGTLNDITGNVALSGRNITFTNRGNLVLDRVLSPLGNAVLRSEEGAISQTSGSALFDTTGLTAYGRDGVTIAGGVRRIDGLSAGAGADVEVVSSRPLELAGDITARNVLLRSNASPNALDPTGGAITQTGGVITADLFRGSAYGAIDLGLGNQIAALGDVWSFTGGIGIASDRALDLTGALTAIGGDVVLDAASIGQSGGYLEAAGLRARATGTIGLDMANRIAATGTVTFDAGADIAFRNAGGFTLGMVDTPGAVTLTSLNGSIGQTVSTRIGASRLSVSAENGGIALDEANLVDTLGGLAAGGDVIFRNVGDFALDGDIAAAGREVALRSNTGTIGQTSGTITALGLDVDAAGPITLGSANNVTNLRNMLSGGNILFRNAGALMLWGDVTGDEVTLGTDSGSLLQMLFTGGIITASRLNASAGGALNFNHANRVTELGDYASGAGVVGFTNDGSLALAGDISGDQLFLRSLTGGITQGAGRIDAGSIDASAAGSILLDRDNRVAADGPVRLVSTSGDVTFRALGGFTLDFGTAAGTFDVTSDNGSIGQSGAVTANRLNARAGGSIALTSDNAVTNLGRLVAGMAGDIAFSAAGDLLLTDAIDAGGTVTLVADVGEITQGGGASITAAALSVSAARDIVLGEANAVGAFAGASAAGDMLFRNAGDVSLGAISSPGTLTITSDAGAVTQDGDLSAGTLTVGAQNGIVLIRSGNVVAGQVNLANLGASGIAYTESGNLLIGSIGAAGQVVSLIAGGDIGEVAGVEAATLNLTATGDVTLSQSAGNRIGALGTIAITNGNFALENADALILGDTIDVGRGTVDIRAGGAIVQNGGIIIADRLTGAAAGDFRLGAANRIGALGAFDAGGTILVTNGRALDIDGAVSATANVSLRVHGGMTINAGGSIASGAAGDAIILASDGVFRNFGGADALSAANGRWLVYSQTAGHAGASDPGNDFGGLAGKSYYGAAFDFGNGTFAVAPGAGNRFVYGYRPVLTVRPDDIAMTYNGQTPTLTSTISGLVNGDSVADAWSGAALLSGAARSAGTYVLGAALGTLVSDMNYDFAFDTGTLRIDPRAIVAALTANDRIYDGTTNATGTLGLSGLVAGDDVTASAILAFDSRNAGTRTATASGIALTGADAGNYVVNATATDFATIGARAIVAALTANDRIYDGTTNAAGTLGLSGVLAGDEVGVSGALAFDSRNAGTRTATASGIALTGADAGNYFVNATATDLATIGARAIIAALTANDRIYDGTTDATGVLDLSGLIAGDDVAASATLAFDSRNAGTRTATASGILLTGADAGNYVVNATATDLATIDARALAATLTANDRIYDGTTNATGTLGLSGVLAGDEVGVSGRLAFDSRNAGSRVVTASGLALTGADAGNYTVDSSVTDAATIARLAVTAAATADSRLYDGTTGATGRIALTGVIAGDDLSAAARFGFADANAGSGRTVTVSDFGVGGADAGNYIVTLAPGPIVADILRRAVSVTVDDLSKIFGQPDPALTYGIASGSLVPGDGFSGSLVRSAGEGAGSYAITQGTLALSDNYLLTVTPGRLTIGFAGSTADASDALRLLRVGDSGFRLDRDPSANLLGE